MADFRAIFGDDDSENEEFLGFDLDDIKEAEEKYVRQLNVLNDLDYDIDFLRWDHRTKRKLTAMMIRFSPTLLNGVTTLDPFKSLNLLDQSLDQRLLWRITNEN